MAIKIIKLALFLCFVLMYSLKTYNSVGKVSILTLLRMLLVAHSAFDLAEYCFIVLFTSKLLHQLLVLFFMVIEVCTVFTYCLLRVSLFSGWKIAWFL